MAPNTYRHVIAEAAERSERVGGRALSPTRENDPAAFPATT
jgi:hypothetical protein